MFLYDAVQARGGKSEYLNENTIQKAAMLVCAVIMLRLIPVCYSLGHIFFKLWPLFLSVIKNILLTKSKVG